MADDSETQALVCDNGSGMVKAGFAGDDGLLNEYYGIFRKWFSHRSTPVCVPIHCGTPKNWKRNDGDSKERLLHWGRCASQKRNSFNQGILISSAVADLFAIVPHRAWNCHQLGWYGEDLAPYIFQWAPCGTQQGWMVDSVGLCVCDTTRITRVFGCFGESF